MAVRGGRERHRLQERCAGFTRGKRMAERKVPSRSGEQGAMRIDPALVRELAELLTENALTEIEVQDGDRRVKVRRDFGSAEAAATAIPMSAPPHPGHTTPAGPTPEPEEV